MNVVDLPWQDYAGYSNMYNRSRYEFIRGKHLRRVGDRPCLLSSRHSPTKDFYDNNLFVEKRL